MAHSLKLCTTAILVVLCVAASAALAESEDLAVAKDDRGRQITYWEQKVRRLREEELADALSKVYASSAALEKARQREGFFYTRPADRAAIKLLDEDYQRALVELESVKREENKLLARLKPLYGVVSTQFVQEQKDAIAQCISTVQRMSYDNAWYSSLFSIGDAESLTDIIVGFLVQWFVGYVVLYPFAVAYYALWKAPWSVLSYCSSVFDFIPAVLAYVLSVTVMCLPLIALIGGVYLTFKNYGQQIHASLNGARRRDRFHQD